MNESGVSIDALSAGVEDADASDLFVVNLDGFEGPLHLLLELARRQKVDLRKVSILSLAEQYLAFMEEAKARRIDLAADYLLMASWLALLKSRLLLPKPEALEEGDTDDPDEMAARLAFRLKRLDAMRQAGKELMSGPLLDSVVFLRGEPERPKVVKTVEFDASLWEMMQAFGALRDRRTKEAPHVIEQQLVLPLESARDSLKGFAKLVQQWESLDSLRQRMVDVDPSIPRRSVTASVFSAALELARDGDIDLRQDVHFAPLYLRGVQAPDAELSHETS